MQEIFTCGIWNPGLWNPESLQRWNPKSKFHSEGTGMEHLESGIHRAHIAGAFRGDFAVFCGAMAAIDLLMGTLEQNNN